jgi:hypothetical protein
VTERQFRIGRFFIRIGRRPKLRPLEHVGHARFDLSPERLTWYGRGRPAGDHVEVKFPDGCKMLYTVGEDGGLVLEDENPLS